MTPPQDRDALREAYLTWTRRALPVLLLPLALTATVQVLSASPAWAEGPQPPLGLRSLFIAVGVAAIAFARSVRQKEIARRPLPADRLSSLSWRLLVLSLSPCAIGAVLALMTRSALDFYLLLALTLVGIVLFYPRFDQWVSWSTPDEPPQTGEVL